MKIGPRAHVPLVRSQTAGQYKVSGRASGGGQPDRVSLSSVSGVEQILAQLRAASPEGAEAADPIAAIRELLPAEAPTSGVARGVVEDLEVLMALIADVEA